MACGLKNVMNYALDPHRVYDIGLIKEVKPSVVFFTPDHLKHTSTKGVFPHARSATSDIKNISQYPAEKLLISTL